MVAIRRKKKDINVHGIVVETGKQTDYDMGKDIEHLKEAVHAGIKLIPEASGVFTQYNWRGKPKYQAMFFDMIETPKELEVRPMALRPFDPTNMWSAEKAEVMLHESISREGLARIITGSTSGFKGNKKLMLILMVVAVVGIVLTKLMGVW